MSSAVLNQTLPAASALETAVVERACPSGRKVVLRLGNGEEAIEIHSPQGEVEVRITLTATGPVVSLYGAQLHLEATDKVAVRARSFEVDAAEGVRLGSQGDVMIEGRQLGAKMTSDVRLDGERVLLNCPEDF